MLSVVFIVFSSMLLCSALGVVVARQPVHAALNLVLSFFTAACLWVMLDAEFLGLVLVLVYVGAVMVLFLFVLMMLDFAQQLEHTVNTAEYRGRATFIVACLMIEMGMLLYTKTQPVMLAGNSMAIFPGMQWSVQQLALRLFNHYTYAFEAAGAILLFAMVAVIGLIKRSEHIQIINAPKRQNIADQVRAKKSDRLVLVKSS